MKVLKIVFLCFFWGCQSGAPSWVWDLESREQITDNVGDIEVAELIVTVAAVGQGDATLVLGPAVAGMRTSLLIDAGGLDPDGGAILLPLFERMGVVALDYLVVTHFDADHMGGLVTTAGTTSLLWGEDCTAGEMFPQLGLFDLGESSDNSETVREYLECREYNRSYRTDKSHMTYFFAVGEDGRHVGDTIDLQGGYQARIIAANGYVWTHEGRVPLVNTDNEKSQVVLITGPQGFAFLVMGDATGQAHGNEDALIEQAVAEVLKEQEIGITVLRVGHHGAANASSEEFLQSLIPEVSVISVGDNPYGHPDCETVETLTTHSDLVLQTHEVDSCLEYPRGAAFQDIVFEVFADHYRILLDGQIL